MRPVRKKQLSFRDNLLAFDQSRELEAISGILDEHRTLAELVWQDLAAASLAKRRDVDGGSLSGEQVLRVLIVKQLNGYSFRARLPPVGLEQLSPFLPARMVR